MTGTPLAAAPPRSDVPPGRRPPSRGGWATFAVVAVIVAVVVGGHIVAAALSEPVGPPVEIPGVLTVRPLSGWVFAGRETSNGFHYVGLTRGSGNLVAGAAVAGAHDPVSLADLYARLVLSQQLSQLSVSARPDDIRLRSGARGIRFAYVGVVAETGTSVEGEVSVVVTGGHGVVFDGWAPAGLLSFVRPDIRAMVDRAEVT
jgi:hypothetical protein